MKYQEALDYLNSFTDYEKLASSRVGPFDLGRVQSLLARLGNPHLVPRTVHVAGTKGKGSTAAMIASILQAAGYVTGLFTSPHLHCFRERIQVDGEPISESELVAHLERVRPLVEEMHREDGLGRITTFELTALLAFSHFAAKGVEFQVVEVGLGGRLDATNVVVPLVAVITSISLDHTGILGDNLAQIAEEKAGIIKPGCVTVSSSQEPVVEEVLRRTSRQRGARLVMVGQDVPWTRLSADLEGQTLLVRAHSGDYRLGIPLLGEFQCENASLAVAAVEEARSLGVEVSPGSVAEGLRRVSWPGRMQVVGREPLVLLDGAHNVHSAACLREAVRQDFVFRRVILVVGTSLDKDLVGIARELAPLADQVIATRSRHPRAAAPQVLADVFSRSGRRARTTADVTTALSQACRLAGRQDLILVTGSLFVVAEALEWAKQRYPCPAP
jgi:dihydrofolate synthase/folylpolyglutamate synthase